MGGSGSKESSKERAVQSGKPPQQGGSSGSSAAVAKSRPKRTNENDRGILKMKMQRDQLVMHKRKLEKQITVEFAKAKEFLKAGERKKASSCLKLKTHHEKLVETTDNAYLYLYFKCLQ